MRSAASDDPNSDTIASRARKRAREVLRPWSTSESTEMVFQRSERQWHASERVIDTLLVHLTEHVVISDELLQVASDAGRRARDELSLLMPEDVAAFANKLVVSGTSVAALRDISRKKLAQVVAVIAAVDENHERDGAQKHAAHGVDVGEQLSDTRSRSG